jgi:hypothetical protein
MMEANKSLSECSDSERILREPVNNATISLSVIKSKFDNTDTMAALFFNECSKDNGIKY